jgi:hypothetical protein
MTITGKGESPDPPPSSMSSAASRCFTVDLECSWSCASTLAATAELVVQNIHNSPLISTPFYFPEAVIL